jgi:hypothetical protein
MTYPELVEAIQKLPVDDRLALLEAIARSLRQEARQPAPGEGARRSFQFDPHRSALDQLLGIARPMGEPPEDAEIEKMIADHLIEKYR